MKYEYTYRELSELLGINLPKLKRWGREFLPPDLSAGQQQGVPRKLTLDDAFFLYFSGVMVQDISLSIPEARTILQDIESFLRDYSSIPSRITHYKYMKIKNWVLLVTPVADGNFWYRARGILSRDFESYDEDIIDAAGKKANNPGDLVTEKYVELLIIPKFLGAAQAGEGQMEYAIDMLNIKMIPVTFLLYSFLLKIGINLFKGEVPPREMFLL